MSLYTKLLLASLITLIMIIHTVKKNKLSVRYSVIWIVLNLFLIFICLFPDFFIYLSWILGIQVASNAVFLVLIFVILCLNFYVYLIISRHNNDMINLNYEIASLKKRIEELEKNND